MSTVALHAASIAVDRKGVLSVAIPLSLKALNVLTQVRRTMGDLESRELAESILAQGQHAPGVVVALTPQEAMQYIIEINDLWGSAHKFQWLTKITLDGVEYCLIVVAGHRRLHACEIARQLIESGHSTSERFTGSYLCEIHFGLTIDQALAIQFHENRHQQVAIHEEVSAAWRTWRYTKKKNPALTLTAFSRIIGRTPGWVRSMLRFCELPESVQQLIEPNGVTARVSYQLLVQVARLLEVEKKHGATFSELEVHALVARLIVDRHNPKSYAGIVSSRIRDLEEGQGDFLFGGDGDTRPLRKVALPHLVQGAYAVIGYWRQLENLIGGGAFGITSPFTPLKDPAEQAKYSPRSPIKLLIKITEALLVLLPHLTDLAKREQRGRRLLKRAERSIQTVQSVLVDLSKME